MSKKLYRPKRKKSKEKLSFMDKLEMGSIVIAAWVGRYKTDMFLIDDIDLVIQQLSDYSS